MRNDGVPMNQKFWEDCQTAALQVSLRSLCLYRQLGRIWSLKLMSSKTFLSAYSVFESRTVVAGASSPLSLSPNGMTLGVVTSEKLIV